MTERSDIHNSSFVIRQFRLVRAGFSQHRCHELGVKGVTSGLTPAKFNEINHTLAGDFFGIEGIEAEVGFRIHIRSQPVAVDGFGLIPEKFLFQPDAFHAFDETPGKQVGIGPQNFVDFVIQKLEIRFGIFYIFPRFFGLFSPP